MLKGILFDLNGTVADILTEESSDRLYSIVANYLSYHRIYISPVKLKELFRELNRKQREESPEKFPEFNVEKIFADIICDFALPGESVPAFLAAEAATVFRSTSRLKLEPYTGVTEILAYLGRRYMLGAVSDGQSLWAKPELAAAGLEEFFDPVIISGDYGFRKPDSRLFNTALEKMGLPPDEAVFVGNDMYRDIYGGSNAGLKTVFFKSNQGDHEFHGVEPDYIIYQFNQLPSAIDFLQKKIN